MSTPRDAEQAQVEIDDENRVEADEQQRRRTVRADLATRLFVLFVVTSLTASMATLAALAVQDHERIEQNNQIQQFIKDQSVENGQVGKDVRGLAKSIKSCTTPGGKCYQRGQDQTASAVANIGRVNILAVVCAAEVDPALPFKRRLTLVSECVADGLAAAGRGGSS